MKNSIDKFKIIHHWPSLSKVNAKKQNNIKNETLKKIHCDYNAIFKNV